MNSDAERGQQIGEPPCRRFECLAALDGGLAPCEREVVAERPMRIAVDGQPAATLMQTPGDEVELALGFLLTEGWARSPADIGAISFCRDGLLGAAGEVRATLAEGARGAVRRGYRDVFSSCGLCGDELIEDVAERMTPFERRPSRIGIGDLLVLRDRMEANQPLFGRTGGAHAAALAEVPVSDAARVVVREDLGRHNALDKAVGAAAGMSLRFGSALLFLSGRLSLEMVAKAARAGVADVAGVSAPSDLAVSLARKLNMFLAGFVRGKRMTVYAGFEALREV